MEFSTQGSFRVYGHCGLWLLPHLGPLGRRWYSRPQSWKTLNTGLCACLGAPGHLLPPFSAKKWVGEAERAGNYPDWSDHAIPEESCLVCVGVEAGHRLRIIKTGMPATDPQSHTLQEILVCPWQYTKLTLLALPGQSLFPTQKYFNGFLLPATV